MNELGPGRFVVWSGGWALAAGLSLLPFVAPHGSRAVGWAVAGWFLMSVIGVVGGRWMVTRHGSGGADFLVAMGICMLSRLTVASMGAFAARSVGALPANAYLVGLAVGYFPLLALEMAWFLKRDRLPVEAIERGSER